MASFQLSRIFRLSAHPVFNSFSGSGNSGGLDRDAAGSLDSAVIPAEFRARSEALPSGAMPSSEVPPKHEDLTAVELTGKKLVRRFKRGIWFFCCVGVSD